MNRINKRVSWQQPVDWSKSGLSQKAYCSRKDLRVSTFSYWHKQLSSSEGSCGKLIRVPPSPYGASVRIVVSSLQLDVPVSVLERVLPVILRNPAGR